ncbi:MAG: DnaJ domain-containing protein, partial [Burkholderiales bacterium]
MTDLPLDCYAILGVGPNAEEIAIHEAFETLAQRYDPEHYAGSKDEAHQKLSNRASAYAILSDPVRRRRYDLRRRIDALIAPLTANDAPRQKGLPPAVVDHS